MIYIYPIGGIGNMFFHIASIWSLAKDNGDELCLINIDEKIKNMEEDIRWNGKHSSIFRYFLNRFPIENITITNKIEYNSNCNTLQYLNGYEYVGYFQSENYFKHRRDEIIELFKPADEFLGKINQYSELFGNISLHVRRNDYLKYSHILTNQTPEYYFNALSLLPQDLKVLVFSDDLDWCRQVFIGDRFIFMSEMDYIEIYLMTKMKYHIIANSSFSWWGAWMSESEKVIAPKLWFGSQFSDEGVVPQNWIRI